MGMDNTSDNALLNLAKARDILLLESSTHMPYGAKQQRTRLLRALDSIIDNAEKSSFSHQSYSDYDNLKHVFDTLYNLSQAGEILDWLQQTHALPQVNEMDIDAAITAAGIFMHRALVAPQIKHWLESVGESQTDDIAKCNIELMQRQWMESAGLEEALVAELSQASSASFAVWEKAKPNNDFFGWLPYFEKLLALVRQKAKTLATVFNVSDYQAMMGLSSFNPGLKNETVNSVFASLRIQLPILIAKVTQCQKAEPVPTPLPKVPVEMQKSIALKVVKALGLEKSHARLDESAHPFSTGQRDDVRITTHYNPDDLLQAIMGVIHETGHALYSRELPEKWRGQPVGEAQSMWIHESQSLFWEMQVAASRPFMQFLSCAIKEELKSNEAAWSAENLYLLTTRVSPTLIRTDADEVTYPAHVILRHDLEQKLLNGALEPKDLPAAWGEAIHEMLGIDVPDHAHGCMQDVHWPTGMIGYFPAYTFGALAAAQLMQSARKGLLDMDNFIITGNFLPIRQWLHENIYQHGSLYSGEELIAKATGKHLNETAWLEHIHARYLS